MSRFLLVLPTLATVMLWQTPFASAANWLLPAAAVWMQDAAAKDPAAGDKASTDPAELKKLIERINKLEAEVERLKNKPAAPAAAPVGGQVLTLIDKAQVGMTFTNGGQFRYVAIHLALANTTGETVTLTREQLTAEIDGEARKLEEIPPGVVNYSFQVGGQNYSLQTMQPAKSWKIPASGQASFWVVFPNLPVGTSVPRCKLKLQLGDATKVIDVNDVQRAALGLEIERIGPRNSLALITVTGTMTLFNTQALVDELDKLVAQKVARVVVKWSADAPKPDGQIMNWIQNATSTTAQIRNGNDMFPAIPAGIREFHLVKISDDNNNMNYGYRGNMGPLRIHDTAADAVGAALRTAYLALPRDELLQEIREGHPLTRAAALAYGGGRLDADQLPLIFQWVEDKNADIQKAALQTLCHFGEPEAVEKLVFYAKRNIEPLSSTAIESLASSRFGTAHDALLELLKNEPPESKKRIVQVLAKFPRPVWSETLYEFASDTRAGLNLDAVKALVQVGHPKLVEVLQAGLKGSDKPLRDFAFQTLAQRTDDPSEKLAVEYALEHLKTSPPDGIMVQLLSRTKDARAVPLLMAQLEKTGAERTATINLLVQIGDQTVADTLAEKYPAFSTQEKALVLNGLRQFRHPKFREFAGAALLTNDQALVSTAANALMQEGDPAGEKLLIAALDKQTTGHLIHNITNALANFGTPTARAALLKAKESSDQNKRNYASNALLQMRQRSPGYQYIFQAQQRLMMPPDPNDKNAKAQMEKEVIEFYDMALQLDPELPEAYAGRGKMRLRQDKLSDAGKDFEKALELDPDGNDSEVITGLALARVVDGKLDGAFKLIESKREKYKNVRAGLYLYNTACVYSRAVGYLDEHAEIPDRDKKKDEYRKKSLADLEQSINQGFADFDWMAKDPDFNSLREDAEFKKIIATKPKAKPKDDAEMPEEDPTEDQ
jgi:HEAT repeat protein